MVWHPLQSQVQKIAVSYCRLSFLSWLMTLQWISTFRTGSCGGVSGNEREAMPVSPTAARMHTLASPQPHGKQTCTQAHKGKQILTLSTGAGQRDQPKPFTVHHQADFQELCTQCEVGGLSGEPPKMRPTKKLPRQGTGKL